MNTELEKKKAESIIKPADDGAKKSTETMSLEARLATAGTLELTEAQKKILLAPVDENQIERRPDGLLYLPWIECQKRLIEAFGLQWTMVEEGSPVLQNNVVYRKFHLIIQGKYCGTAIGEQSYIPSNQRMTYGDACEGAKSNALVRLCKRLGIGQELWDRKFIMTQQERLTQRAQLKADELKERLKQVKEQKSAQKEPEVIECE